MKKISIIIFILLFTFLFTYQPTQAQQVERNFVVVEIGTGTWCGYCPGAAMGADDLVENGHKVAIIENHNGDSYANTASNNRNSYYNISGYPTAFFDGANEIVGGSPSSSMYPQYLSAYEDAIDVMSDFTVDLTYTNTGLDYDVTVEVTEPGNYSGQNLVVHLTLTESHIPESWQGMSEVNFVNRAMYPDHNGTSFTGGTQTFNISFTADASWEIDNCELVAFIQDNDTKEILQSDKTTLAQPTGTNNVSLEKIYEIIDICEGAISPVIKIKNNGSADINSLTIEYDINSGATTGTYNWSGDPIAFNSYADIELDEITFDLESSNSLELEITQVNSSSDDDPSDNSGNQSFSQAPDVTNHIFLELHTDNWGSECTWNIKNSQGEIIKSGGPYGNNQTIEENFFLDPDCNTFNLMDSYGDGGGEVILEDSDGTMFFYTNGSYGSGVSQSFSTNAFVPTVFITPEDGSTGIAVDTVIEFHFNQPVRLPDDNPITNPASLVNLVDDNNNDVAFSAEINDDNDLITITPNENLEFEMDYLASILSETVENQWDMLLQDPAFSTFTTEEDTYNENMSRNNIKIYPNPASLEVNITNVYNSTIEIYSILGEKIYSHRSKSDIFNLDISNFDSGNYIIKIVKGEKIISKKINIIK